MTRDCSTGRWSMLCVLRGVGADLTHPTPCRDWDLRMLRTGMACHADR
jgi:hypothetical protein